MIRTAAILTASFGVALLTSGCSGGKPLPTPTTAAKPPAPVEPEPPQPVDAPEDGNADGGAENGAAIDGAATAAIDEGQAAEAGAPDSTNGDGSPGDASNSDNDAPSTAADAPATDPLADFPRERLVVLAPEAMLLVELVLSIDGEPHTVALDALVERVLAAADTDKDGRPTWDEVAESGAFRAGLFGNQPLTGSGMVQNMKRLYDIDSDGVVDADEVPRFVTRNAGGSKAFSLLSANYNREHNRLDSPLRRLIDYNRDGLLSAEEIAEAPQRVRSFDSDGDDILYPVDFAAPSTVIAGMQQMQLQRGPGPPTAMLLSPAVNWTTLLYSLEEMYAYGGALTPDSFPHTPGLFEQLDDDGDGKIDRYEVQQLAGGIEPHVVLAAHFGDRNKVSQAAGEQAGGSEAEDEQKPAGEPAADKADASAAEAERETAQDAAEENEEAGNQDDPKSNDGNDEEQDAAETDETIEGGAAPSVQFELVSLSPVLGERSSVVTELDRRISLQLPGVEIEFYMNDAADDSNLQARAQGLLGMYDGNNDGYLEEDEIPENAPGLAGDFAVIDADGDGKVYAGEIEALLAEQQAAGRSQIRARAYDQEDALFTALDVDNDGRLNAREIDELATRLQSFDTNGDGHLATYEIPASIAVGVARGDPNQGENLFIMPAGYSRASDDSAPEWFVNMDANADGDVSPREFVGGAEMFGKLDRDGDGYVSGREAVEYTAASSESSESNASGSE